MKKRIYKKPFMELEVFAPNVCTTPCQKNTLLIFEESSFYMKLYYDNNPHNDHYDSGEMVADYNEIPTTISIDLNENKLAEGFYQNGQFINIATNGRIYYKKSTYNQNTKAGHVFAAKDKAGNYYYFSSRPTTRDTHS